MKKGHFESDNVLENLVYKAVEGSIPPHLLHACPFEPGVYSVSNITISVNSAPLSQLAPSGMYRANVNVSVRGEQWGYGWGTAEAKTPMNM